jgi:hypothetical protein
VLTPCVRGLSGAALLASLVGAAPAVAPAVIEAQDVRAGESYPARCGTAVAGTPGGYVPLPRGDVFCPLITDPKAIRSFVSYQRGDVTDFAGDIAAIGIGDQFGFFRVAGARPGDGVQLGLAGAVFAQFDVATPSFDLLNADYIISLPLTFRRGRLSGRARIAHQSSHLGDEFLLRPEPPDRENLSFESAALLLSSDMGALRLYGGGEYFFRRDPVTLPDNLAHAGVEFRPGGSARLGTLARARLVGGVDVKAVNDSTWRTGVNLRAGIEFDRPQDSELSGRRWSILAEFYDGPSPYGQFHRSDVRLTGVGFHFTL